MPSFSPFFCPARSTTPFHTSSTSPKSALSPFPLFGVRVGSEPTPNLLLFPLRPPRRLSRPGVAPPLLAGPPTPRIRKLLVPAYPSSFLLFSFLSSFLPPVRSEGRNICFFTPLIVLAFPPFFSSHYPRAISPNLISYLSPCPPFFLLPPHHQPFISLLFPSSINGGDAT